MNKIIVAGLLSLAICGTTVASTTSSGAATPIVTSAAPAVVRPGSVTPPAAVGHAVAMTPQQLAAQRTTVRRATTGPRLPQVATYNSGNWSGLLARAAAGTYQGVSGAWHVPAVTASTKNKYSCAWIGIDGWQMSSLIQMGTESDSVGGRPRYYAWLETLPATQTLVTYTGGGLAPVAAGDAMWSYIYRTTTTGNTWAMYLQDITQGWTLSTTTTYATRGASAEWVQEATQVGGVVGPPPPFSKVTFTDLEVLENNTWYYTAMTSANEVFLWQGGTRYASPSAPSNTSPQRFSVTYG